PGVPRAARPLAEAVRPRLAGQAEVEVAFRLLDCPVVAITGTNGKSTTTTLVGHALQRAGRRTFTGGNLGRPLVLAVTQQPGVAGAEVSSFQLQWAGALRPRGGCLLYVAPGHLHRPALVAEDRDLKTRGLSGARARRTGRCSTVTIPRALRWRRGSRRVCSRWERDRSTSAPCSTPAAWCCACQVLPRSAIHWPARGSPGGTTSTTSWRPS